MLLSGKDLENGLWKSRKWCWASRQAEMMEVKRVYFRLLSGGFDYAVFLKKMAKYLAVIQKYLLLQSESFE